MPDEIDRDQAFNERCLEALIEQSRLRPTPTPSLQHCRLCGKAIPEKRRQTLPGVTTCTDCQSRNADVKFVCAEENSSAHFNMHQPACFQVPVPPCHG